MNYLTKLSEARQTTGICTCPNYPWRWDPNCPTHLSPPNVEAEYERQDEIIRRQQYEWELCGNIPFLVEEL